MQNRPINVLFLCTRNSARSIIAESLLNHLAATRFRAYSAGSSPTENGWVHPLALRALQKLGVSTAGLRSKSWDEFDQLGAPLIDVVITICEEAAKENCPDWPGRPNAANWFYPDPAAKDGTGEQQLHAFIATVQAFMNRLTNFIALPEGNLDKFRLQQHVESIDADWAALDAKWLLTRPGSSTSQTNPQQHCGG